MDNNQGGIRAWTLKKHILFVIVAIILAFMLGYVLLGFTFFMFPVGGGDFGPIAAFGRIMGAAIYFILYVILFVILSSILRKTSIKKSTIKKVTILRTYLLAAVLSLVLGGILFPALLKGMEATSRIRHELISRRLYNDATERFNISEVRSEFGCDSLSGISKNVKGCLTFAFKLKVSRAGTYSINASAEQQAKRKGRVFYLTIESRRSLENIYLGANEWHEIEMVLTNRHDPVSPTADEDYKQYFVELKIGEGGSEEFYNVNTFGVVFTGDESDSHIGSVGTARKPWIYNDLLIVYRD